MAAISVERIIIISRNIVSYSYNDHFLTTRGEIGDCPSIVKRYTISSVTKVIDLVQPAGSQVGANGRTRHASGSSNFGLAHFLGNSSLGSLDSHSDSEIPVSMSIYVYSVNH